MANVQRSDSTGPTLVSLVADQVARTPDAVAVIDGDDRLTYAGLSRRADEVANLLRERGVGRESVVGVCLTRSAEMIAAVLGVQRAGGAYVPLDPTYPFDRLALVTEDATPAAILCEDATLTVVGPLVDSAPGCVAVDVRERPGDRVTGSGQASPAEALLAPRPEDAAYVIYTSGSTGRPKGAVLEHRNTVAMLESLRDTLRDDDLSGVLFSTSLSFDLSVFEIFGTLSMGGTIVVAQNGLELAEHPNRDLVTLINTVPAVIATLARGGDVPASVTTVITSGDVCTRAVADAVASVPSVRRHFNLYGPTECVTWQIGDLVDPTTRAEPPLGRAFSRVRVAAVGPDLRDVPTGEIGELLLIGDQVGRGYLRRPELTAERFIERNGERAYRTGDLVSIDDAGVVSMHGRADHQVKIRGFRVELGDIEAAVDLHPDVNDSVVTTLDAGTEREIVAHVEASPRIQSAPGVVADPDGRLEGPEVDALRVEITSTVAGTLPGYMVPQHISVLARMPRTLNGKRDRAALPDVAALRTLVGVAAATDLERSIADAVAEVMDLPPVPVDLTLGALGVDSLRAAAVVSRLRRAGILIPLRAATPLVTVSSLAELVQAQAHDATAHDLQPVEHDVAPGPLTPTQQEFWLGEQLSGSDSAQWTVPLHLQITGALDTDLLSRALDLMPRRHPALSTAITAAGDLVRVEPRPVPCEVADLRDLPAHRREVAAVELLQDRAMRSLDLPAGDVLRVLVARVGDDRAEVLVQVHHCAFDGLSTVPFLRDLAMVHDALAEGRTPEPAPRITSDDAARWLERQDAETHEARAAYWRDRMSGVAREQQAPGGGATRVTDTFAGGRVERVVPDATGRRLSRAAEQLGVSPYAIALATLALRVHRETGRDDIVLASAVNSREHPDLADVVGLFLRMGLVRVQVDPAESFAELARRLAREIAEDAAVGHLPWGEVLALADLTRPSDAPRSELLTLAMQGHMTELRSGGLGWRYLHELDNGGAKADATLFWEVGNLKRPHLALEFARERYTDETAGRLLDQILVILDRATSTPDAAIGELDWLTTEESAAIRSWSGASVARAGRGDVLTRFLDHAGRTPDALAVDCPRVGPVTYAQLLGAAQRVSEAIPPGTTPVAVAARRSARGIAAMLGAWLAGRAYLPLDVEHPPARLAHALTDSEVELLLVDDDAPALDTPALAVSLPDLLSGDATSWAHPRPAPTAQGARTAYRIYTSGSTGTPKGVTIGSAALSGFLDAMSELVPLGPSDVMAHVTTPSFDISGLEVWHPLTSGASVRVVPDETARDGFALAARLDGCTAIQMTPTGWQLLLQSGWAGDRTITALVGGESVPAALAGSLARLTGTAWNVYGPTEATIWATAHRVTPELESAASTPIGRPLGNSIVHVLDASQRPVPPGVVGEIWIGGHGLADGYQNLSAQTAERFVDLPWLGSVDVPARFYRTGDLGRWNDGVLECLGRTDGQIKIRGVRMEIDEIESVLRAQPTVRACAVGVARAGTADAALVGYVVAPEDLDTAELERGLLDHLPSSYVPRLWVRLPELPLTGNGKIARNLLPEPGPEVQREQSGDADREPPRGDLEELVADIWAEVLGEGDFVRSDHFMRRGGHSLLATKVVALLREDLELAVPVRLVFERPRLAEFAAALGDLLRADLDAADVDAAEADDVVVDAVAGAGVDDDLVMGPVSR